MSASLLDPSGLLLGAGPWVLVVIAAIVVVETGLLFPFLPGDSLVFTAALLGPRLGYELWQLVVVVTVAAAVGDSLGYEIGRRWGRARFHPDARVLRTQYLDRADLFLARYGGRSIVLARFVPIVRTFLPPVVGMSSMRYSRFLRWNLVGALTWATLVGLAGHHLGRIPFVAGHVEALAVMVVTISLVPVGADLLRSRRPARSVPRG